MLIKYSQPVEGKRERICRADEATVSRIIAPSSTYDGMVERLQVVSPPSLDPGRFIFQHGSPGSRQDSVILGLSSLYYHIYKYLGIKAAKSLFPDNFIDAGEFRVFNSEGRTYTAMYSAFVPDETKARDRCLIAREAYALLCNRGGHGFASGMIDGFNQNERQLNPFLDSFEPIALQAGLIVAHPEFNYHLTGGKTVFFELCMLDAWLAACASIEKNAPGAIDAISLMLALQIEREARAGLRNASEPERAGVRETARGGLGFIFPIIHRQMGRGTRVDDLSPAGFHKMALEHWDAKLQGLLPPTTAPDPFCMLDPRVHEMLKAENPVTP